MNRSTRTLLLGSYTRAKVVLAAMEASNSVAEAEKNVKDVLINLLLQAVCPSFTSRKVRSLPFLFPGILGK